MVHQGPHRAAFVGGAVVGDGGEHKLAASISKTMPQTSVTTLRCEAEKSSALRLRWPSPSPPSPTSPATCPQSVLRLGRRPGRRPTPTPSRSR